MQKLRYVIVDRENNVVGLIAKWSDKDIKIHIPAIFDREDEALEVMWELTQGQHPLMKIVPVDVNT